jgi:hypothetical protein
VPNKALMPSMKGYPMDWVASTLPFFHREELHISAEAETTSWRQLLLTMSCFSKT